MNGIDQAIEKVEAFLNSNDKGMLITGTHQYEKHKLIMKILNKHYEGARILFRTNGMDNITNRDFLGWAKVNKTPKCGERVRVGKNYYEFDNCNNQGTWNKTSNNFDFAILYPLDSAYKGKTNDILEDLYEYKNISKIFLISWTDDSKYNFSNLSDFFESHVIYDAEEENPAYHQRVIDIINK
jgi:hypothetical protein